VAWWSVFATSRGVAVAAPPKRRHEEETPSGNLQPWQKAAWGYFKTLGEIHYGCGFYARMLAGIVLEVQERDASGEWVKSENPVLVEQLERLEGARGGMSALQGQYGRLRFIQGEAMLACTLEPCDEAPGYYECWEMLSCAELSYSKSGAGGVGEYTRKRKLNSTPDKLPETDPLDPLPGTMVAWRFYHRDPEYSGMADCSMRAVLEDCEELLLLKRAIRNTARNRGAGNGVLILPAGMGGQEIDAGDGKKIPKNAKAIYDALTASIADETASHAVTPVILFAPPDTNTQTAFHIDLRGAALYKETGLRDECIRRIGIGLDMPPEALLGTASANHWTAWQIDDAAWTNHGDPVAREFVEELTAAILHPAAEDAGLVPEDCRVWFDATAVVEDPDRARASQEAFDRITISEEAYRRETGWEESDAPDDAEWQRRAALRKAHTADPAAQGAPEGTSVERVIGMAEACVLRCRELAGSKLRTKMQRADTPANLRARIGGAHNCMVAAKLAADVKDEHDAETLVAGAGQAFLLGMFSMGLERSLAETLVRRVEEHAANTLWLAEPGDLPDEVLAICGILAQRK
jgi:hypothetical protein